MRSPTRWTALFLVAGCTAAPAPADPNTAPTDTSPIASVPPPAPSAPSQDTTTAAASSTPAVLQQPGTGTLIRITTAMPMEGTLDGGALVKDLDAQTKPLDRCAALVRKTDGVVGSLNVQVDVAADGNVQPSLQSPANPEAERCLLEAMRAWRVTKGGHGRAMVLLQFRDK